MAKTLEHSLEKFAAKHNRPLRVIIYNTGGTITCVLDEDGLLAPTNSMSKLRTLLMNRYGMNLKQYVDSGLLDVRIKPIFFMDSSQMVALDREVISKAVVADYELYDGALVLHGTDTGALTAQHLSVSLPYYNPIAMWERSVREKNFTKPVLVVSSQIPATFPMSDAANNVHIGIEVILFQFLMRHGLKRMFLWCQRAIILTIALSPGSFSMFQKEQEMLIDQIICC